MHSSSAAEESAIQHHSVCSVFAESLAPNRDLLSPINSTTLSSITAQFINLSPWLFWLPVVKTPPLEYRLSFTRIPLCYFLLSWATERVNQVLLSPVVAWKRGWSARAGVKDCLWCYGGKSASLIHHCRIMEDSYAADSASAIVSNLLH